MKNIVAALLFIFPMIMGSACDKNTPAAPMDGDQDSTTENTGTMNDSLLIRIGGKEFTGTLLDNPSAAAFKAMLPLTINMTELNGNEKYFRLLKNLPTNESDPGTIKSGDLMLWGSNTLVLFYKAFNTSYSYTKLGKIENPSDLSQALGSGNITVTFELLANR